MFSFQKYLILILSIALSVSLSAQVVDDFSDGDFTVNPTWSGNQELFTIDNLVLRSNSPDAADYFLSTPNALIDDTEWNFWINLDFATSGANFVDVYLVADVPDLTSVSDGYFIRFGDTEDEISFYKISGGSVSIIIDGPDGQLGSSNNVYRVKMTRTSEGNWSLELDEDNTGTFLPAGTVLDNDHTETQFFGVRIEQSSAASVVNNHFFDDFSIAPIPVDETPPQLADASAISDTQIEVVFSEALEAVSAELATNYSISDGIGNPTAVSLESSNTVLLTLSAPLDNGSTYELSVNGVSDLAGNPITNGTIEFTYFVPSNPSPGDVIFNELFPDPNPPVALPEAEFVEIHNLSDEFFDTENWVLVNTTTERFLESAVLPPGGFLILCDEGDASSFDPFGQVLGISSFTALSNAGDSLTLRDNEGEVLDIVVYTNDWYNDPDKDDGGYSMERINPTLACSGEDNWSASNSPNGGTPGETNSILDNSPDVQAPSISSVVVLNPSTLLVLFNEPLDEASIQDALITIDQGITVFSTELSQPNGILIALNEALETGVNYALTISGVSDCEGNILIDGAANILIGETPLPGDLIISEIMADPTPGVGLPESEYFELFNKSDKTLELIGVSVSEVIFEESVIIEPLSYLAVASVSNEALWTGFDEVLLIDMSTSFLTNGGRELILQNGEGDQLDFVEYSDEWYGDPDKDDGGYSLELINPVAACSGEFNWIAASAPAGGTPGSQNSVFDNTPDQTAPILASIGSPQQDQILLTFSEPLDDDAAQMATVTLVPEIGVSGLFQTIDTEILVQLDAPLDIGVEYNVQIEGISDCEGNVAPLIETNILLGVPPSQGDLLITEIMADPSPTVGLPEGEYFELFNASNTAINLSGSTLSGVTFNIELVMAPGEYRYFASISNQIAFLTSPDVIFLEEMSATFLTNGGRELDLRNPEGERIDRVEYSEDWYRDADKADGGYSLERINLSEPCRGGDNWIASDAEQGGTPGGQNSVFNDESDETAPEITAVFLRNQDFIEVRFSEVIDSLSIFNLQVDIVPPLSVGVILNQAPNYSSILIELTQQPEIGIAYQFSIDGITDCTGNPLLSGQEFLFAVPEPGLPGELVINEVLFNPRTGGRDFVEIYNASSKNIGLQNWVLQNAALTTRIISEDPLIIFPGQHLVLTDDPSNITLEYPRSAAYPDNFFEMESLPSFNNGEGSVILGDSLENEIDRFDYLEDYHFPLLNSFDGVSLERVSYTRASNDEGNWSSASERVGFATPGYVNSQFLQEGRASASFELQNEVFSPDNDGFEDILLINYTLDQPDYLATIGIYDRRGRLIRQLTNNLLLGTTGTISWDGTTEDRSKARVGPHVVLVEIFNPAGETETFKLACVVAGILSN